MKMAKIYLLMMFASGAWAQWTFEPDPDAHSEPSRNYDLIKITLDMRIDVDDEAFAGTVVNRIRPLHPGVERLVFDCVNLEIKQVTLGDVTLEFDVYEREPRKGIEVLLDRAYGPESELDISITYAGSQPEKGLYFIRPDEKNPDKPWQVWTQGEDMDNRYWIPTYDYPNDRAQTEFKFTVRDPLNVVSNGHLVNVKSHVDEQGVSWRTFHWKMDQPYVTYLMAIGAGDWEHYYDEIRLTGRKDPLRLDYYVNAGVGEATARRSYSETPEMMRFFSDKIGVPYMWDKYAQVTVTDFVVGGMENVSVTLNTDRTLHDERAALDRSSRDLVAHELAHQWWGDYLTSRSWSHLWLNEGFATYFEALYNRHIEGDDAFRFDMSRNQINGMGDNARARPIVESFVDPDSSGHHNAIYTKGSSVLYMLHHLLGDELWWLTINHYANKHAYGLVDTHDFAIAVREASGRNFDWFFQQWVYLAGYPEFEVDADWDAGSKLLTLSVDQVQTVGGLVPLFRTPVDVAVHTKRGVERFELLVEDQQHVFTLPVSDRPQNVRFDADSVLVKQLTFEKPEAWWAFQLEHDPTAIGRYLALEHVAEKKLNSKRTVDATTNALKSDSYHRVRAQAAQTLAVIAPNKAARYLLEALDDEHAEVRADAALAMADLSLDDAAIERLIQTFRHDLSYWTQAAALETLGKARPDQAEQWAREGSTMASHDDVVKAAAIEILGNQPGEEIVDMLLAELTDLKSRSMGQAVFRALAAQAKRGDEATQDRIVSAMIDQARSGSSRLAYGVVRSLSRMDHPKARTYLQEVSETHSSRWVRNAAAQSLRGSAPRESSIKDELGVLKERIHDLEKRLETKAP